MKVIIAGGRDYNLTPQDFLALDKLCAEHKFSEIVSGCQTGADTGGEIWAASVNLQVKHCWPDWKKYGRKAGPIRNKEMAEYADAVVLFPGNDGTASMRREAAKRGLKIFEMKPQ